MKKILIIGLFFILSSCSEAVVKQAVLMPSEIKVDAVRPDYKEVSNEVYEKVITEEVSIKKVPKNKINKEIKSSDNNEFDTESDINQDLWKSALEVISKKMPIIVMEKEKGLIVTDWGKYYPNLKNERCKINVSIIGKELSNDNLVISVFKQVLKDDEWINVVTENRLAKNIKMDIMKNVSHMKTKNG